MTEVDNLVDLLALAKSPLERKMFFLGWLNKRLEAQGVRDFPVLVGGSAVALYTGGNYATLDIDLTYGLIQKLNDLLLPEGFYKDGRYWVNDTLDLLVECPGTDHPERITKVELGYDLVVYVSSVEDMIIDRLCAYVFWNSPVDGEWARVLIGSRSLDLDYLRKRAGEEDVLASLTALLSEKGDLQR